MTRAICRLPDAARRVLVLVNPRAGARSRGQRVHAATRLLRAAGWSVEVLCDLDQLAACVGDPVGSGVRAVVAAGGDGTVSSVVNRAHPDTPIAVLPLGTENLLARYLGCSSEPEQLCRLIALGATVRLDAARAADRIFLLMASCGFDAEVVRQMDARRRGHIRHASYIAPILRTICSYQYPALRLSWDAADGGPPASPRAGRTARWLFVFNVPRYAGGLRFVPDATGSDGLLDVCAFERGSFAAGLRYLGGVVRQRHLSWPDCWHGRVRTLRVESDAPVHYQVDGDYGGTLPVDIAVLPERLRLVVCESWAVRHGFRPAAGAAGASKGVEHRAS